MRRRHRWHRRPPASSSWCWCTIRLIRPSRCWPGRGSGWPACGSIRLSAGGSGPGGSPGCRCCGSATAPSGRSAFRTALRSACRPGRRTAGGSPSRSTSRPGSVSGPATPSGDADPVQVPGPAGHGRARRRAARAGRHGQVVTGRPVAVRARRAARPLPLPRPVPGRPSSRGSKRHRASGRRWRPSQDLLTSAADEDQFEALATTVPLRVDPVTGATVQLGPPACTSTSPSRPTAGTCWSTGCSGPSRSGCPAATSRGATEVWTAAGKLVKVVADLPVSDEVPRMGVPTGPRQVAWDERAPARLLWTEALRRRRPGRGRRAPRRDHGGWRAPFDREPSSPSWSRIAAWAGPTWTPPMRC